MNELTPEQADEINELIFQEKKLAAVKRYRECCGGSLAEAKAAVEKLTEELKSSSPARFELQAKSGCAGLLVFFVATLMTGVAALTSLTDI